jgi:multidrug efflux pump subunit AcrA (membrane-fusion protein)
MKRYKLYTIVIMTILVTGCAKKDTAGGPPGKEGVVDDIPVFAVSTVAAEKGQIANYLALAGDIVAGSSVDAYPEAAGKVINVYKAVGDRVVYNEPLAQIDPSRPGMSYVAYTLRSPLAGTITAFPAQLGMTVSQQSPIARIMAGRGALEIKLYVAERFISKIALNLPCEITLDAWPGEVFRGHVSEISPIVDAASRTMEIKVNVDNQGDMLKAGMFAKVRIITERKEGVVKIPESARIERFGEIYVYVVGPDPRDAAFMSVSKRPVKSGILIDNILEIQEGLSDGEEVIVKGQSLLEDGARVTVIR